MTTGSMHISVTDMDRYLELRMRRQKRLAEGMRFTAILSEAAIRQQVGGPDMLRAQLHHITRATREFDVDGETSWTVHERDGIIRQYVHAFASAQAS